MLHVGEDFLHDLGACIAIAVGIRAGRHRLVGKAVVEQVTCLAYEVGGVRTNEFECACFYAFLTLGDIAQHKHRLAETGSFFLQATGIGEH